MCRQLFSCIPLKKLRVSPTLTSAQPGWGGTETHVEVDARYISRPGAYVNSSVNEPTSVWAIWPVFLLSRSIVGGYFSIARELVESLRSRCEDSKGKAPLVMIVVDSAARSSWQMMRQFNWNSMNMVRLFSMTDGHGLCSVFKSERASKGT